MKKSLLQNPFSNYAAIPSKNISTTPHNMTIITPSNYKLPVSILFNEELTPKNVPYSASTQAPKKRNRSDENNNNNNKSANDQTLSNYKKKNESD